MVLDLEEIKNEIEITGRVRASIVLDLVTKVEQLKDALHNAEAIGDFSDELRSRYQLKQKAEYWRNMLEDAISKIKLNRTNITMKQVARWEEALKGE